MGVRLLSVLLLLTFYEGFSIPVKKKKNAMRDINQIVTTNKLNEIKSEHSLVTKLICEHLTP